MSKLFKEDGGCCCVVPIFERRLPGTELSKDDLHLKASKNSIEKLIRNKK